MGFESIDQPSWSSEVNIIQKETFHFIGWRGVVDGVWVHWPAWPTSEIEHNPKSSISFYWLERGGRWGLSSSNSLTNHQKMNITQKWAFHFFVWRGVADHQKLNVIQKWVFHFIGWRGVMDGVWVHRPAWLIIRSKHNPKRNISFYWLERGGGWGLSPLTSLANIRNWT